VLPVFTVSKEERLIDIFSLTRCSGQIRYQRAMST
jgi:hypothetical protein